MTTSFRFESAIVMTQPEGAVGSAAYPAAREEVQVHLNGGTFGTLEQIAWIIDSRANGVEHRVSPDSGRP